MSLTAALTHVLYALFRQGGWWLTGADHTLPLSDDHSMLSDLAWTGC